MPGYLYLHWAWGNIVKQASYVLELVKVDELALLSLQESYSVLVLMYAMPTLFLKSKQLDELNVCWNNVIRRIFNYNRWQSIKSVLFHISCLNITHLIMTRKINFYRRLHMSRNCILHNVFMSFLSYCCDSMCCSVFINKSFRHENL